MAGCCRGCAAEAFITVPFVDGEQSWQVDEGRLPGSAIAVLSPQTAIAGLMSRQAFPNVFAVNSLLQGKLFLFPI